jgi:hypothetical protein
MADITAKERRPAVNRWRLAGWGAAAALLLHPLIAMPFTDEVDWDVFDFVVAGALIGLVGLALELAVRKTPDRAYRAAAAIALGAAFILIWINLAVGIIGNEDNPANLMYAGVLAVGLLGAIVARFRPLGMAWALAATAIAQVLVAVVAAVTGLALTIPITVFFGGLWLTSAWLFRRSARRQAPAA